MLSTRAGKEKKQRKNDTAWFYNIWLQYIFAIYCIFYITTLRYCIDAGMPNMDILINKLKHNKKEGSTRLKEGNLSAIILRQVVEGLQITAV